MRHTQGKKVHIKNEEETAHPQFSHIKTGDPSGLGKKRHKIHRRGYKTHHEQVSVCSSPRPAMIIHHTNDAQNMKWFPKTG